MKTALALVLLLSTGALAAEDIVTVEAVGEAAIVDKNRPLARDRALEDALRNAVAQACGTLVTAATEVRNNQLVSDKILTQAKGYLAGYDLVNESDGKGVVRVTVKARVGTGKLATDLESIGLTLARKGMPRMALLIAEQRIDQLNLALPNNALKVDQRLSENTFLSEWAAQGFTFVETDALAGAVKVAGVVGTNISADQVRTIGDTTQADVLVVGTAVAIKQQSVAELVGDKKGELKQTSCSGTVSARIFNADNGEVLAADERTKTTFHLDALTCGRDALVAATKELSVSLKEKLLTAWNKQLGGTGRVRVTVKGLESLGALNELKTLMLQNMRGVKGIDQKRFAKGQADLDVRLEGPADSLAQALEGKPLQKQKLSVTAVTPNTIEVTLVRQEKTK